MVRNGKGQPRTHKKPIEDRRPRTEKSWLLHGAPLLYANVPTAGQVMKCMVAYSEAEAADLRAEQEADRLYEERVRMDEEEFSHGTR
jgi:hypothetical protein